MKIMSVVFELDKEDELEYHKQMAIYKLFSKICQENNITFFTKIEKNDLSGYIIFDKSNSDIVRKISRKVNKTLSDCKIDYMVSLPMIMDGVAFKVPTFYVDGKIKIMR